MSYVGSYIWKIRQVWGHDELLMPGVSALVFNTRGQVLLGFRTDHKQWCHIGGSAEIGQSAEETMRRELLEECGIDFTGTLEPFAFLSRRELTYREYADGDKFSCWGLVMAAKGLEDSAIVPADEEHSDLRWFDLDKLPAEAEIFPETLHILDAWGEYGRTGRFVLR